MFSDTPALSARDDAIINRARDILDRRFKHWDIFHGGDYCYVYTNFSRRPKPGLVGIGWCLRFQIIDLCRQICKERQ